MSEITERIARLEVAVEGNLEEATARTFAGDYSGAQSSIYDARANLDRLVALAREVETRAS